MLKACKGEVYDSELECICSFYKGDLSKDQLETQLTLLQRLCRSAPSEIIISDVIRTLSGLQSAERVAISAVWIVMKLLGVIPATNALFECLFSTLRRIKTYLRTTISQERLNNLMLLHLNAKKKDELDWLEVDREFKHLGLILEFLPVVYTQQSQCISH